ncbi:hypothetical protein QTP88_017763 [Uroleucon formosanum]
MPGSVYTQSIRPPPSLSFCYQKQNCYHITDPQCRAWIGGSTVGHVYVIDIDESGRGTAGRGNGICAICGLGVKGMAAHVRYRTYVIRVIILCNGKKNVIYLICLMYKNKYEIHSSLDYNSNNS